MNLFNVSSKYPGFKYPFGLEKIADLELVDFDLWFLMDAPFAQRYCEQLAQRFPRRHLIPFAKRTDNDDVACFELEKGHAVQIIHDFADPGWEQRCEYPDFWSWFSSAVTELIETSKKEEAENEQQ